VGIALYQQLWNSDRIRRAEQFSAANENKALVKKRALEYNKFMLLFRKRLRGFFSAD
jgi:hypothetical protein